MESYYETDRFKNENKILRWNESKGTVPPSGPPGLWLNEPPGANPVWSHLATEDRHLPKRQGSSPHWLRLIPWGLVAGSLQQEKIPSHRKRHNKMPQPTPGHRRFINPMRISSGFAPVSVHKGGLRPYQPQSLRLLAHNIHVRKQRYNAIKR